MAREKKAKPGSERDLLRRVLSAWSEHGATDHKRGTVGSRVLINFNSVDDRQIFAVANSELPLELHRQNCWIIGAPTPGEPALHPVASVSLKNDTEGAVALTIRIALFADSPHHHIPFILHGWRFESPEPDRVVDEQTKEVRKSPRPFAHAQPTLGWYQKAPCMVHAHLSQGEAVVCEEEPWTSDIMQWRNLTNEIQPGFPLRSTTIAGQAIAVLVSLYGAPATVAILDSEAMLRSQMAFNEEFKALLGLD